MAYGADEAGHFLCDVSDSELQGGEEKKQSCSEGMNLPAWNILYLCFAQIALCMKHFIQMQELKTYYYSW